MRFIRKTLVAALLLSALVTVGAGGLQSAHAARWFDQLPRPNSQSGPTPTSGEPDVGSTRVRRTMILTTPSRGGTAQERAPQLGKFTMNVRWLGWVWVDRYLGMGL